MKNEDAQPLPHLNTSGQAHMVDITGKQPTVRQARARAFVQCSPKIMVALRAGEVPKGDALAVAPAVAFGAPNWGALLRGGYPPG